MKYFLSIDRGSSYDNGKRYLSIPLNSIKQELAANNNLRDLCLFTMSFLDMTSLKKYLIENNLLSNEKAHYDLVFAYKSKKQFYPLSIPFKPQMKYFSLSGIREAFISKKDNPALLKILLEKIHFHSNLPDEYYTLKAYLNGSFIRDPIEVVISNFVDGLCKKNGKINFRNLYDLAIIVSLFSRKEEQSLELSDSSSEELDSSQIRLRVKKGADNPEYHQYTLF